MGYATTPASPILDAAMSSLSQSVALARVRRDGLDAYEMRVFRKASDLGNGVEELRYILLRMPKAETIPHAKVLLKMYRIAWVTLADVLASVINEVYELGYADRDIEFDRVLRNRNIQRTSIPAIFKKHRTELDYQTLSEERNDIVHRGRFDDPELREIELAWIKALPVDGSSDALQGKGLDAFVRDLVVQSLTNFREIERVMELKKAQLSVHLKKTEVFLEELADELVAEIRERLAVVSSEA